ncbi:hypothetical protein CURTO8I2_150224 [Curtobacterium sp. 8I-2]|nr:hypothetical protein CURTO8I2_150224 [Curtobacterium sp. 8I-2]
MTHVQLFVSGSIATGPMLRRRYSVPSFRELVRIGRDPRPGDTPVPENHRPMTFRLLGNVARCSGPVPDGPPIFSRSKAWVPTPAVPTPDHTDGCVRATSPWSTRA